MTGGSGNLKKSSARFLIYSGADFQKEKKHCE
jgi:hypothetical protein